MTALTGDWEDAERELDADLTLVRGGNAKEWTVLERAMRRKNTV